MCPCNHYSYCMHACTQAMIEAVLQAKAQRAWIEDDKEMQDEFQRDWKEERDGSPYA